MRIGITSPVVVGLPGAHATWEQQAGIEELGRIAETADRLGFDHLTCSEHVGVPVDVAEVRGGTYWDPLATFGYLAAVTRNIRLATQVLVLGYHHPLEIAKRYGTLDRVSSGRLVLGCGVGSLEEEFELLGATWQGRGALADDALAALRASFGRREPEYHGTHFDFSGFVVEPHAVQTDPPIWIGGRTPRSLRRAATHGTGWIPFGLKPDRMREMLDAVELPDDFEVVLGPGRPLDPSAEAERAMRAMRRLRDAGATVVTATVAAESAEHYCEQLEALKLLADKID